MHTILNDKNSAQYPVLPVANMVLYPGMTAQIAARGDRVERLLSLIGKEQVPIAVFLQKGDGQTEVVDSQDLHPVGVMAQVYRIQPLPNGVVQMVVQGMDKVRLLGLVQQTPYLAASVEPVKERSVKDITSLALARNLSQLFHKMVDLSPNLHDDLKGKIAALHKDPGRLADFIASGLDVGIEEKQSLLQETNPQKRLERLTTLLNSELEVLEMGHQIQHQVHNEVGQAQRQHYLREQMRIIQQELGETDELADLEQELKAARLPAEAQREAERELDRLRQLSPNAADYTVIRTYLDWLAALPWHKRSTERLDLEKAQRYLDQDHQGLQKIKDRILEHLAVRRLNKDSRGPILCFVGPPGVGKTSLGRSIARSLGRKFARIALGGVRDEAEIRGHRRTYVGALPGRIIQTLRKVGTRNPVLLFDEIDKVGMDHRGDPAAALLEVLDPEQNSAFSDHYLDLAFDLSDILFITTANQLDTIPPALRDRLEVIQLPSYTEEEKVAIAQSHLVPRQRRENGLSRRRIRFATGTLEALVRGYTQEAGVRTLERQIGHLCRALARQVVEGKKGGFLIRPQDLQTYLGAPSVRPQIKDELEMPGMVAGLAWTPVGGEVMYIEATKMPGAKALNLTGKLGEVMRESAQIALSYIRARSHEWDLPEDFFEVHDIHIHFPAGAVPKDGPSAGLATLAALLSMIGGRSVRQDLAMTGELTLSGRVLPVGGIKEKVLAAHRAGIKTVILPHANQQDLEELQPEVRQEMDFVLVREAHEIFPFCFMESAVRQAA